METKLQSKQQYPRFIQNKPCGIDKFDGGSQERLAKTIARHFCQNDLLDEECTLPRIIGIEGIWGSGKSNVETIIFTVYSKTVLPIRRLKICKIKSITEKPQEPTSHELPKGSAMTLPEFMVFLFQSKDKQTNKRGDENGLQSIDRSRA